MIRSWEGERASRQLFEGQITALRTLSATLETTVATQQRMIGATASSTDTALISLSNNFTETTDCMAAAHKTSIEEATTLHNRITSLRTQLTLAQVEAAASKATSASTTAAAATIEARLKDSESACTLLATQLTGTSVYTAELAVALRAQYSHLQTAEHKAEFLTTVAAMGAQKRAHLEATNTRFMVATVRFVGAVGSLQDPEARKAEFVAYLTYAKNLLQHLPREDVEHLSSLAQPIIATAQVPDIQGCSLDVEEEGYSYYRQMLDNRQYTPLVEYEPPNGGGALQQPRLLL